jgi:hypothetical protein
MATKKQKKSSKQHGTKDFFFERKGQSHHISRKKKSLKEPYCDKEVLKIKK